MTCKTHHVAPNLDGVLNVKKCGRERRIKHFDKKQEAAGFNRYILKVEAFV